MRAANTMLILAMDLVARQVSSGRCVVCEHPATATSRATEQVQIVAGLTGVRKVTFDQCRYGLTSPSGLPLRKRTTCMTICSCVAQAFEGKWCQCTVPHRHIIGAEFGQNLSSWAAHYPPALCRELALCAQLRRQHRAARDLTA